MIKGVIEILRCPVCGESLKLTERVSEKDEIIEGSLECSNGHEWQIRNGVIDFCSQEQTFGNSWSEYYKDMSDEEMEKKIFEGTPKNQRELNDKCKEFISEKINNGSAETILDIATGRGTLLTHLVKNIKKDVHIICTDLSFQVLMYDRLKVKKINPNVKVTYIACDATNLPIKNDSIGMAVSFFGIANMMDIISDGVKEAYRVLKEDGRLLNTGTIVEKGTEKYNEFQIILKDENINMSLDIFTKEGFKSVHDKYFEKIELITIGESIGEKNDFDGIPFEGEWFSIDVAVGTKH